MNIFYRKVFTILIFALTASNFYTSAQKNPALFSCLKWRNIGPFRGGRTVGASGNRMQPHTFYMGVNNGGVWKTTDAGRTWNPIFDDQPTGSIGDVAVAPSNPNTIYVASGEGIQRPDLSVGDGMYKSTDAGKTWQHLGLREGLQIGGIAIDPENENCVFAAVLGHPYGPNKERGVYRTTNGGKTWKQVLYIDENTGAIQVTIDPVNPEIVYADMYASRLAPWENGEWTGPGSGLYKSTDGGSTWKQLKKGLPTTDSGLGRIGFCIAPSNHHRLYAVVSANERNGGLYRSNDGGESWKKMSGDMRLWDRGDDFAEVKVDPKNADIVYDANVVVWKSTDGGKTWNGWKGAPGGDDYHRLWINPDNTDVILLASDQGAGITLNGGKTWSSWYNQPTAQLYHVSADNAFPYNVYSGQQESGSVGIASRGNDGAITFRDWHPVNAQEYGYVVADPLDPNIIYGGKISKYDKRTGQSQDISPDPAGKYRFIRTAPILFSPVDKRTLFYAGNVIFTTRDGGHSWKIISPDLTRKTYDVAPCVGVYARDEMKTMPQRGVVYTVAPSPLDANIIWAGTDDGLIHVTTDDGKNWKDVTPPGLTAWSKVSLMDASHSDKKCAYAAVNRIRLDDLHPHIYRTKDGGKTWTEIVNGLPNDPINVVKEDPQCKGLLYAGSERAVYVSFDDGDHWQSLRMNMPATSIRDLCIKDNDIVVATHGRSFWIMDDITSLREIAKNKSTSPVTLYRPADAYRVRWNMNTDTPLPPDEPVGENPPDGAIIDYYLKDTADEVTINIYDASGKLVIGYTSGDTLYQVPKVNIPDYWIRPQQQLSTKPGAHRFLWDMHYEPFNTPVSFSMSAIYEDTPPAYTSPWVMPGTYNVMLTILKKDTTEAIKHSTTGYFLYKSVVHLNAPLKIIMDPRVKTSHHDLQLQHDLSYQCYKDLEKVSEATQQVNKALLNLSRDWLPGSISNHDSLVVIAKSFLFGKESFAAMAGALSSVMGNLQGGDMKPTSQCVAAGEKAHQQFQRTLKNWQHWQGVFEKIFIEADKR
jgi:photosystem II stability/assembly factor-like uncharacterized protein